MLEINNPVDYGRILDLPLAILDFSAEWCQPCKLMAMVLNSVSAKWPVATVDNDSPYGFSLAYGHSVSSLPTIIVLRHGEEIQRWVGLTKGDTIRRFMEEHAGATITV